MTKVNVERLRGGNERGEIERDSRYRKKEKNSRMGIASLKGKMIPTKKVRTKNRINILKH